MTNLVFIGIYLCLLTYLFKCLRAGNYWTMLLTLLLFLVFSPMMQYVYFPQYKNDALLGIRQLGFSRVWLEYIHSILLIYILNKIPISGSAPKVPQFFAISFLLLNCIQFFTCIDFSRSINGYIVSVLNPVLFCLVANKTLSIQRVSPSRIISSFYKVYLLIFLLFYVISAYNFFRGGGYVFEDNYEGLYIYGIGGGLGIFRDRVLMTPLFLFMPMIFLPLNSRIMQYVNKKQYLIFIVLWLIMLLLCNSRTMYVAVAMMVLGIAILNPFDNRKTMILLFTLMGLIVIGLNLLSNNMDISDIIFERFHNKGTTVLESAQEDERFLIWDVAKEQSANTNYMGVGIGNFTLLYSRGYSNAHSLYYSVLVERGICVLLWVFAIFFAIAKKNHNSYKRTKNKLFITFFIGIFLYAFVSYTGEEFFNVSQVAYSISPYFLFLILSISYSKNIALNEDIYSTNI